MSDQMLRINAGYILPVTSPVIQNGSILINNGRIQFIGRETDCPHSPQQVLSYPNHLLMPGLVNAHTHLSLSNLKNNIKGAIRFVDWIKEIISHSSSMTDLDEKDAVKKGIKSLISSGTTTIGDISGSGVSMELMREMKVRGVVFLEIIGFKKSIKNDQMNWIDRFLRFSKSNGPVRCGLSPHAPYSVSPQLIQSAYHLAKAKQLPLAMHIAETIDELEFIGKGKGALRRLLEERDKWEPDWKPQKKSPIQYLESLNVLKGITGIHLNHMNEEDLKIIKKKNMSAVYCPGSNQWFQRKGPYPLMKFLKNKINVAIGTDSLASNDKLNMFEELTLIKKHFPDISDKILIQMATINGAKALGLENVTGSLETGKKADIIALKINKDDNIYKSILSSGGDIAFSMVEGEIIFP